MKTLAAILLLLLPFGLWSQNAADSVHKTMPATYEAIYVLSSHLWVSLYDEKLEEIEKQSQAVLGYLELQNEFSDTLRDIFLEARTKAFNRYAENKDWALCEQQCTETDLILACINPNWVKAVAKMNKIIDRKLNPREFSFTLEL